MLHTIDIRSSALSLTLFVFIGSGLSGCCAHFCRRPAADARILGSVVDEVNLTQEENAELAKFTIYMHEFEINSPPVEEDQSASETVNRGTQGYQLTDSGKDHVRQIARQLLLASSEDGQTPSYQVIVERSNTSKLAATAYQYPVHHNSELDAVRRQMVVSALQGLGVTWAESCVIVAPAFATGMGATESAAAYQRAFGGSSSGSRGLGNSYSPGGFGYRP